ncbi:hypothetical protein SXCC_04349 [Gluconacetobacter sp. SXCC-1]|nr:hypothetical protein SXCC_04349 [Gluconacetobacter sp. SXCC-1]
MYFFPFGFNDLIAASVSIAPPPTRKYRQGILVGCFGEKASVYKDLL